ncbi:MAG: copper resistance protein B [Moraxellaceae bacterium]|nr:MAG: copper resistance protein B [Moraxellaceae bacterium]
MNSKKNIVYLIIPAVLLSLNVYSHENDDPILANLMFDKLEKRDTKNPKFLIDAQSWIGTDLNKFWLKADVENHQGETEHAEMQALYSRAVAPFWDIQIGIRQDTKPMTRTWSVLGIQGLAPYFFDIDAALFIGEAGRTAAKISAEYDLRFTQRLILSPEIEIAIYGQNDTEAGVGSGLSSVNTGLRLRYEIRREFAPYIGIDWSKKFGTTANYNRRQNEGVSDTQWVMGLRMWY